MSKDLTLVVVSQHDAPTPKERAALRRAGFILLVVEDPATVKVIPPLGDAGAAGQLALEAIIDHIPNGSGPKTLFGMKMLAHLTGRKVT